MKVLLIEDDHDINFIYKRQLDLSDMQTDAFFTGKEALEALGTNTYDIALVDIMLPDTNGIDIVKQMKQNTNLAGMTIIVLSNMGEESIVEEAKKIGADGYLIKSSMNPGQLIEEILKIYKEKQDPQATSEA